MYVVFVDDTEADLDTVAKCLPSGHFKSIEKMKTSREFLRLIQQVRSGKKSEPALVMLDMSIGDDEECGLKLLDAVRAQIPHIPVVMVSQSKLRGLIYRSFEQGAASFIHKTVTSDVFQRRVEDMLSYWSGVTKIPATANL